MLRTLVALAALLVSTEALKVPVVGRRQALANAGTVAAVLVFGAPAREALAAPDAKAIWARGRKGTKATASSAAFPSCGKAWDKDKPCPGGAGFRLEGDKRFEGGKVMHKGNKEGAGGSGDVVYFNGEKVKPR